MATLPLCFLLQHACAGEQHFSFLSQQVCAFVVALCGFTARDTFCSVRTSVRPALLAFTWAWATGASSRAAHAKRSSFFISFLFRGYFLGQVLLGLRGGRQLALFLFSVTWCSMAWRGLGRGFAPRGGGSTLANFRAASQRLRDSFCPAPRRSAIASRRPMSRFSRPLHIPCGSPRPTLRCL